MKVIERKTVGGEVHEHVVASKLTDQQALAVAQTLNNCPQACEPQSNYLAVADGYEGSLVKLLVTVHLEGGCVRYVELDDPAADVEVPFDLDIQDVDDQESQLDDEDDELDKLLEQEDYLADEGADEQQTPG